MQIKSKIFFKNKNIDKPFRRLLKRCFLRVFVLKTPRKQASSRELSLVSATKLCFMGSYSDALALPTN